MDVRRNVFDDLELADILTAQYETSSEETAAAVLSITELINSIVPEENMLQEAKEVEKELIEREAEESAAKAEKKKAKQAKKEIKKQKAMEMEQELAARNQKLAKKAEKKKVKLAKKQAKREERTKLKQCPKQKLENTEKKRMESEEKQNEAELDPWVVSALQEEFSLEEEEHPHPEELAPEVVLEHPPEEEMAVETKTPSRKRKRNGPSMYEVEYAKRIKLEEEVHNLKKQLLEYENEESTPSSSTSPSNRQPSTKLFECKRCSHRFTRKGNLNTHIKKFHPGA